VCSIYNSTFSAFLQDQLPRRSSTDLLIFPDEADDERTADDERYDKSYGERYGAEHDHFP
jgi:hypothetical protein